MQTFKKLLFLISPHERKRAGLLLIMIIIMALMDMLGVASILPFIAVLTNPSLIETNIILNTIFKTSNRFGIETNQEFLFILGVFVSMPGPIYNLLSRKPILCDVQGVNSHACRRAYGIKFTDTKINGQLECHYRSNLEHFNPPKYGKP